MNSEETAIKVLEVNKTFKLPHEQQNSIKGLFLNIFRGRRRYEKQRVLKDISFEIKKGDFFGIVGRNGGGKSTLLKLLAGIYSPDSGHIAINGKLTPFIELGVGFNPELTGRENVFLNGALLGFNRTEMLKMYDSIVEFAELEKFMDQKLKNYSSGMQVRLAFSIAIRAESDILLLDEVLAVGDENFQQKCYSYFAKLKKEGRTVVLVSHDMNAIRNYCTKALLVHEGEAIEEGSVDKVVKKYTELNITRLEHESRENVDGETAVRRWGNGDAKIEKVWTSYEDKTKTIFRPAQDIEVNIQIKAEKDLGPPVIGMIIQDEQGRVVFATNTIEMKTELKPVAANENVVASFTVNNVYGNGSYRISCAITNSDRSSIFSRVEDICEFRIAGRPTARSLVYPEHKLTVRKK